MARRLLSRVVIAAAFAFGLAATDAAALETREVEAVVTILERLAAETGKTVFFDEESAQEWFEIDDESSQPIIPAAGFTEPSWKDAFDQTMTGFIATISPDELEKMMEELADKLGEVAQMTPEEKQEVTEMLHAEMGKFDAIRERGAPYRSAVEPYAMRLRILSLPK